MATEHTPKALERFPGYSVDEDGVVYSDTNWRGYGRRALAVHPGKDGYPRVRVMINGRRRNMGVHRLVAMAFLPPRPSAAHQLRHADGNKGNSAASNLLWGTAKDNAADRDDQGHPQRQDLEECRMSFTPGPCDGSAATSITGGYQGGVGAAE